MLIQHDLLINIGIVTGSSQFVRC